MKKREQSEFFESEFNQFEEEAEIAPLRPIAISFSGLYEFNPRINFPNPPNFDAFSFAEEFNQGFINEEPISDIFPETPNIPIPGIPFPIFGREELRLDVDGRIPLMKASGTIFLNTGKKNISWIANLKKINTNTFTGSIWYKEGEIGLFPFTSAIIRVTNPLSPSIRAATVIFSGGTGKSRTITYKFISPYFRKLELEFDFVEGTSQIVTSIDTFEHPNHPATIPNEVLTIDKVFQRQGFEVKHTTGENKVPISISGADHKWTDGELNDAMMHYWSKFANKPQWSLWTLFASLYEDPNVGGIMFDEFGPNHRQGCAVFYDSFIKTPPQGDPKPDAWVKRMKFFAAIHEMGHCFNLAHSWQKSLPVSWIPLVNEPNALSFMNYPHIYPDGREKGFFSKFEYRFSDGELLFMRHAPFKFVEMGYADWFQNHGFNNFNISPDSPFRFELRTNKVGNFEFMEPVMLEMKLMNITTEPMIIDNDLLKDFDNLTIIIQKEGKTPRELKPLARQCHNKKNIVLNPGESVYAPLFASVGLNGWEITEPGYYMIQVALELPNEDIISNPLRIKVNIPQGFEEANIAQDFFTNDVGRVLTFDGSRTLTTANDTLREVIDRFPRSKAALHSMIAIGTPLAKDFKMVEFDTANGFGTRKPNFRINVLPSKIDEARTLLEKALTEDMSTSAETLGNIEHKLYTDNLTAMLTHHGEINDAIRIQDELYKTLSARKALKKVLDDIKLQIRSFQKKEDTEIVL